MKSLLTDALVEELGPIQSRLQAIQSDSNLSYNALAAGSRIANKLASENLHHIMQAAGLHSCM